MEEDQKDWTRVWEEPEDRKGGGSRDSLTSRFAIGERGGKIASGKVKHGSQSSKEGTGGGEEPVLPATLSGRSAPKPPGRGGSDRLRRESASN